MTAPEADGWDELERLARAISPKRWRPFISRASNTFAVMAGFSLKSEVIPWTGLDGSDTADTPRKREALARYLAAANPAAVLKLIEAARLNRGGDEGRQAVVREDEGDGPDMIEATATGRDGSARRIYIDRSEGKVYEIAPTTPAGAELHLRAFRDGLRIYRGNVRVEGPWSWSEASEALAALAALQPQGGE